MHRAPPGDPEEALQAWARAEVPVRPHWERQAWEQVSPAERSRRQAVAWELAWARWGWPAGE
jgi:hypothetical protein